MKTTEQRIFNIMFSPVVLWMHVIQCVLSLEAGDQKRSETEVP